MEKQRNLWMLMKAYIMLKIEFGGSFFLLAREKTFSLGKSCCFSLLNILGGFEKKRFKK